MAYQPCILGTARLNNFRLGYYDQMFAATVLLAGQSVRTRVTGLTIRDVINDAPNTCSITFDGAATPQAEQAVRISINKRDPRLLFNGALQTVDTSYEGRPEHVCYPCTGVDDTARANRRRPFGQWTTVSATTYAQQLIQQFASGFSTAGVQAGLPAVSVILDGTEGMAGALAQGAQAIGGYYYFEDNTLYFFITPPPHDDPSPIDGSPGNLLDDPPIAVSRDVSQLRTRQYGRAHGEELLADVGIGETILPVANVAAWFAQPGSGLRAIAVSQQLRYTGIQVGGNGSLVGPGAAPGNPPAVVCVLGSGVNSGQHSYAYTFVTPSGETLPSPLGPVAVGLMGGPTSAPTPGTPSAGDGPDTGTHSYGTTFLTAGGETAVGPASATVTTGDGTIPPPTGGPLCGTPTFGNGPDSGVHYYATTFVTARGETVPGPVSAAVTTGPVAVGPPTAPNPGAASSGGAVDIGNHNYATTFYTASGETAPSPLSATAVASFGTGASDPTNGPVVQNGSPGGMWLNIAAGATVWCAYTYITATGETRMSPKSGFVTQPYYANPSQANAVSVAAFDSGNTNVTGATFYHSTDGVNFKKGQTVNGPRGYVSLNDSFYEPITPAPPPPSSNTTGGTKQTIPLSGIATGPAGTIGRKVYRTTAGGSQLKLLTTIADNTTTSGSDAAADSTLGANAPTSGNATILTQVVPVSAIQVGPAGTTARKLYRTTAGGSQLKLLATFGDNATTSFSDTVADASLGAAAPTVGATSPIHIVPLTAIPLGPSGTTGRKIYRTAANGSQLRLLATLGDNTTTTFTDATTDAGLGANAPTVGTAPANAVSVSGIVQGAAPTTSRKLYRTAAGASQLKLLATLGDNTTTAFADTTADASLGANAPTADTSGLAQPSGQVLAGSPTLIVASAATFPTSGWALIGSLVVVRYTGISGNALTGIPATGPGSITTTVIWGTQVLPAPSLVGVTGVIAPIVKGTLINLWVQRDDTAAQSDQAAIDTANGVVPADGIYEGPVLVDERRNEASMRALCDATLIQFSRPIVTVRYACRDIQSKSGRTVRIDLANPAVHETLTIQEVIITEIDIAPHLAPRFTVTASTARFSLDDILRRLLLAADSATTLGRDATS